MNVIPIECNLFEYQQTCSSWRKKDKATGLQVLRGTCTTRSQFWPNQSKKIAAYGPDYGLHYGPELANLATRQSIYIPHLPLWTFLMLVFVIQDDRLSSHSLRYVFSSLPQTCFVVGKHLGHWQDAWCSESTTQTELKWQYLSLQGSVDGIQN